MSNVDESVRPQLSLGERFGLNADQAKIFDPQNLLSLLMSPDGKTQFIRVLESATGKNWDDDQINIVINNVGQKKDAGIPKTDESLGNPENIEQLLLRSTLIWVSAHQTFNVMARDMGDGLACQAITADYFASKGPEIDANHFGFHPNDFGSRKHEFSMRCLNISKHAERTIPSFDSIRKELREKDLVARYTDNEFFLMGKFSSEKDFILRGGRAQHNNFIRIQFGSKEDLSQFLLWIKDAKPDAAEIFAQASQAGLTRMDALPYTKTFRAGEQTTKEKYLEIIKTVGWPNPMPEVLPFTQEQIADMKLLDLDRQEDAQ